MIHLIAAIHVGALSVVVRVWYWLLACVLILIGIFQIIPQIIPTAYSAVFGLIVYSVAFFIFPTFQVFISYLCEHFKDLHQIDLPKIIENIKRSFFSLVIANIVLLGIFITGIIFAGFIGYGLTEIWLTLFYSNTLVENTNLQHVLTVVALLPVVYLVGRFFLVPFVVINRDQKVLESFEYIHQVVKPHRLFVFLILMFVYWVVALAYVVNRVTTDLWSTIVINAFFGLVLMFYYVVGYILYDWLQRQTSNNREISD